MRISHNNFITQNQMPIFKKAPNSLLESVAMASFKDRPLTELKDKGIFGWVCRRCNNANGDMFNCCQWCGLPKGG